MTNQSAANQSNANKLKEKEGSQQDENTEVACKDAGHCGLNSHNLLLGLTIMGTYRTSCLVAGKSDSTSFSSWLNIIDCESPHFSPSI